MSHFHSFMLTLYAVSSSAVVFGMSTAPWRVLAALVTVQALGGFIEETIQRLRRQDSLYNGVLIASVMGAGGAVPLAVGFLTEAVLLFAGGLGLMLVSSSILHLALRAVRKHSLEQRPFSRSRGLVVYIVVASFASFIAHMANDVVAMQGFVLSVAVLLFFASAAAVRSRKKDASIAELLHRLASEA